MGNVFIDFCIKVWYNKSIKKGVGIMLKTFALYGESVTYVSVDVSEEEYSGIKKLMAELHNDEGVPYDKNVDLKEVENV